jgi:hypothetical protein
LFGLFGHNHSNQTDFSNTFLDRIYSEIDLLDYQLLSVEEAQNLDTAFAILSERYSQEFDWSEVWCVVLRENGRGTRTGENPIHMFVLRGGGTFEGMEWTGIKARTHDNALVFPHWDNADCTAEFRN